MTQLTTALQPGLDPHVVGAKAANLGRAMEHGFSVPAGAVLTRSALRLPLEDADLLAAAQDVLDGECPGRQADAHERLCERVLAAPLPAAVTAALAPVVERLLGDAPHGLAVPSEREASDAVCRCWCASWSPQVAAYARRMASLAEADEAGDVDGTRGVVTLLRGA